MDVPKKMPVCKHSLLVPVEHVRVDLQINFGSGKYCCTHIELECQAWQSKHIAWADDTGQMKRTVAEASSCCLNASVSYKEVCFCDCSCNAFAFSEVQHGNPVLSGR